MATNTGTVKAFPVIKFVGPGTLFSLSNFTTKHTMNFNITLQAGEEATLDLRPGEKTFISTFRGSIIYSIIPGSDTNTFHLAPGKNDISIFIDDPAATTQMTFPEKHASYAGIASNEQ